MENPIWAIEAHLWFESFDEYAEREKELIELLGEIRGDSSVVVFFRATPEYVEIPGASFDHKDEKKIGALISFCGKENVDLVVRVSRDASRQVGCLRGKQRQDE